MIYDDDYESIDDIARGEGFFIDDDPVFRAGPHADGSTLIEETLSDAARGEKR